MAETFHVNGACGIYIGSGVGGSRLGFSSADGVKVEITSAQEMVFADQYGPAVPGEVLNNGSTARFSLDLYKYDDAVLSALNAKREGGAQGQFSGAGILMFTNGLTTGITLASPIDGKNYYFPQAWLAGEPQPVQLSTQLKIWSLQFMASPYFSSPSSLTGILYQFV